jgi:hypothetical protein
LASLIITASPILASAVSRVARASIASSATSFWLVISVTTPSQSTEPSGIARGIERTAIHFLLSSFRRSGSSTLKTLRSRAERSLASARPSA